MPDETRKFKNKEAVQKALADLNLNPSLSYRELAKAYGVGESIIRYHHTEKVRKLRERGQGA